MHHGNVVEPGVDPDEVDRGSGELVLEAGLGHAAVAGFTQTMCQDSLEGGAFNARTDLVALFPLDGLLLLVGLVEDVGTGPLRRFSSMSTASLGDRVRPRQ